MRHLVSCDSMEISQLRLIDASRVTLAIQDPNIGTVRSLQVSGTWHRCEYIDDIRKLPQDVVGWCIAIEEIFQWRRSRAR